jgi:hypothetical protein
MAEESSAVDDYESGKKVLDFRSPYTTRTLIFWWLISRWLANGFPFDFSRYAFIRHLRIE